MIQIFHVPYTRSVRPIWLAHEMDLPIEVIDVDWSDSYRQSDEWLAISPTRKVPALIDGDLKMFESGAMVSYLLEKYGKDTWLPEPGSRLSALHHQWCWYSEATLPRPLGVRQVLQTREQEVDLPALVETKVREALDIVDAALADNQYLVGNEFTAADVMMGYTITLMEFLMLPRHQRVAAYLGRLKAREGFKIAFGPLPSS